MKMPFDAKSTFTVVGLGLTTLVLGAWDAGHSAVDALDTFVPAANAHEYVRGDWHGRPLSEMSACNSLTPALVGGPMPEGDVVAIRWLGTSNYEIAFHDKVIVMDTFFERPGRTRSVGFTPDQITRADAILIGHAHFDHISDVAKVAAQTGAPVYGSQISTTVAQTLGVPAEQTIAVTGDNTEHFHVGDIKIQPTHIIHSKIEPALLPDLRQLYADDSLGPLTPAQAAQAAEVSSRGSFDPNITTLGTMGFTMTLTDDFTIVWFDSISVISPEEQALADQLHHHVDVALLPWTPHPVAETQIAWTYPHVDLLRPDIFEPTHQDHIWNAWLDNGLQPLFMKIRDNLPSTKYYAPLYRSAMCIQTAGPRRGEHYLGK